jgi:hypothetical protein
MPLNRYNLAHFGPTLATLAVLLAATAPAAQAATPGSRDCATRCAQGRSTAACAAHPSVGAAVSAARIQAPAPAWLPEWIGPAPVADVADYSALYAAPAVLQAPGMIVAIDAETGMPIRPSAAQRRALALGASAESSELLAPSDAPMLLQRLPGGGGIMTLNGHYQMYSIARVGADGRVVTDCAHDAATAQRMLTATSKPRVRAEKE